MALPCPFKLIKFHHVAIISYCLYGFLRYEDINKVGLKLSKTNVKHTYYFFLFFKIELKFVPKFRSDFGP